MTRAAPPVELEHVACNLCGARSTRPFARRQGFGIVSCRLCALVYVDPRPSVARLIAHYNGDESSRVQYYRDVEPADRRSFAALLDQVERARAGRGALLDVGTNVGTCLALARERGWRVRGVEINAEAARVCREERGLDVLTGVLAPGVFAPRSFDVVVLSDVIEHLPDPLGVVRVVNDVLRPGGLVAISTPDISGWAARALQVKPEEHLYYFTPATLRALVERAGLELLECRPFDRWHNLTAMTHSTTCGGLLPRLGPLFRAARSLFGDVVVRLPLRENLLALARRNAESAGPPASVAGGPEACSAAEPPGSEAERARPGAASTRRPDSPRTRPEASCQPARLRPCAQASVP